MEAEENRSCISMDFENDTGRGRIRAYSVFPGILLCYSDFEMESYASNYAQGLDMFGFEYCLEGKIQWERQDGTAAFLGPGSFMPYDYERNSGQFQFPQRHFKGISFGICLGQAEGRLPQGFPVDLQALRDRFRTGTNLDLSGNAQGTCVLGLVREAEHRTDLHRKLACLELLLFLRDLRWTENQAVPFYLPREQAAKMKQIVEQILTHLDHRYTLTELSAQFHIPVTSLRRSFAGIYGCSAAEFARKHRIREARRLLRDSDESTTRIAAALGYDNPSKFAAVFRSGTGQSPTAYRASAREQNGAE